MAEGVLDSQMSLPTQHWLIEASSQADVPRALNNTIAGLCHQAIAARGVFTIALSGGSLAGFLSNIRESFQDDDPRFDCWHVILADERCVPTTDADSNMGSLQEHFFSKTSIPKDQIHGIDESLLSGPTDSIAAAYQETVQKVLEESGGALDLAVLGFGPDVSSCCRENQNMKKQNTFILMIKTTCTGPYLFVISWSQTLGGNRKASSVD
jgi:6-phosphogluconolactonase